MACLHSALRTLRTADWKSAKQCARSSRCAILGAVILELRASCFVVNLSKNSVVLVITDLNNNWTDKLHLVTAARLRHAEVISHNM